ncbi:MAG: hypothetical protein KUG77_02770, partial [Nannocystaceae bacterium]|nr:hypothetical protein [Nannocystaceae bacterium]
MCRRQRWMAATCLLVGCAPEVREDEQTSGEFPTTLSDGAGTQTDSGDEEETTDGPGSTGGLILDVGAPPSTTDPDGADPEVCEQDIDVVFVMDVSTTMGPFLGALADQMLAVDQAIAALNLPSAPHYGLVVFVDDFALLGKGQPYADAAALQA